MTVPANVTTQYYWDVNGFPLQNYAYNIATLGGRTLLPLHRGENRRVAYRPGSRHRSKTADSRTLSLGMWVQGTNDDGSKSSTMGTQERFQRNLRELQHIFWDTESAEFDLTKRWWDPLSGTVKSATARAELVGEMPLEMQGDSHATVVVDVHLADPYFYGPEIVVDLQKDVAQTISNPGDATSAKINLTFFGQLQNPELRNTSLTPDNWVRVGTALAVADSVILDVTEQTATRTSDSSNIVGAITRSGARPWFTLRRGSNTVELTATSGDGTATLRYQPAYF